MARSASNVFLLATLLAATLAAQPNGGDLIGVSTDGYLYRVTQAGVVKSYRYGLGTLSGWTMDYDNRTMIVSDSTYGRLFLIDRDMVVYRIYNIPHYQPMNLAVDHNGDVFFTDELSSGIARFASTGGFPPVVSGLSAELHGGLAIDVDTSDLLVTRAGGIVDGNPIFRVRRDGSAVTTIPAGVYGRHGLTRTLDGTVYVASCCSTDAIPRVLYQMPPGQSQALPLITSLPGTGVTGMTTVAADRGSAPTQRLLFGGFPAQGLWLLDLQSGRTTRVAPLPADLNAVGFVGSRNVGSIRDGWRLWRLSISFPGEAGRPFRVVFGLSGVRPPIVLPDGRRIWLHPDGLTEATLKGPIPPFLTGTSGFLSADAEASPIVDLATLPARFDGLLLWVLAFTTDPAAPSGIATVSDPMVFRIE